MPSADPLEACLVVTHLILDVMMLFLDPCVRSELEIAPRRACYGSTG